MAFTCDYCCQNRKLGASNSEEDYRFGVLTLLCEIAAGEGGGGGGTVANITGINGVAPSVGAGAVDAGTTRVTLGGSPTVGLVAGSAIIGNVRIDQTTPGTTNGVQVNAALPAGSNIIGNFRIDQTTDGTTNAVHLVAGTALAGKFGIDQTTAGTTNAVANTVVAAATGWTSSRVAGLVATVTQIKGSAGKLGAVQFYNPNTSVTFVQMFKVATAGGVTLGTTVADKVIGVPPLQSYAMSWGDAGTEFANGIQVAATTTATGSTAPSTGIEADFDWK